MVSTDDYSKLIDYVEDALDFNEFFEQFLETNPCKKLEQAKIEYYRLPVGERLPEDEDPFTRDQVPLADNGACLSGLPVHCCSGSP